MAYFSNFLNWDFLILYFKQNDKGKRLSTTSFSQPNHYLPYINIGTYEKNIVLNHLISAFHLVKQNIEP